MSAMDRLHLDYPFAGARMLRDLLRRQGSAVGRARVTRLMKKMSIEAIYRKSNTSWRNFAHKVYPYLLRNLTIDRVNQVWAMDIMHLPMKRGFLYLAAVIDWIAEKSCPSGSRSDSKEWRARNHEYRSGQPVHQPGIHRSLEVSPHPDQYGWQGLLARQHDH
jgi:hypothetical protein